MTDLDELEKLAKAADQGEGQSMYTHPRDSNNFAANQAFAVTFDAPTVLRLVAIARAAETLAAFAKTAPGRLPQPIQDAIELADSCRAAASLERMAPPVVGGGV